MLAGAGNWAKMLACGVQFVACAKISCSREDVQPLPYEMIVQTAHLMETDNGIVDIIKQVSGYPGTSGAVSSLGTWETRGAIFFKPPQKRLCHISSCWDNTSWDSTSGDKWVFPN